MTSVRFTPVTVTCQEVLPVSTYNFAEMSIPPWYPGAEAKPAPGPLLRVQAFVNTRDVEEDADLLADVPTARSWLQDSGLLAPGAPLHDDDLELARELREAIRAMLERDGEPPVVLAPVRELLTRHQPRLQVRDGGELVLENPSHQQLSDGLFDLLLIVYAAQQDGSWSRMKACAEPDCRWAFYDRSRNQQGSWCNMATCGNRHKNRELRARRR